MNLRFRRRKPDPSVAATKRERDANQEAAKRNTAELEQVKAQWPRVWQYAESLREHAERNHFAASLATIYRGGDR